MENESLEINLRDYSDDELRLWKREWKEFHESLPDKIVFNDGFIFYKQNKSGLYISDPPERAHKKILEKFINYLVSKFL